MPGVQRIGTTKTAQALQKRKLIRHSRSNITIPGYKGLEAASCECYEMVKRMHDG